MPIYKGDDRRRLVPIALVQVLTTLIDELGDSPDETRARLRSIRSALCRVYRLPDPSGALSDTEAMHLAEELDDAPIQGY